MLQWPIGTQGLTWDKISNKGVRVPLWKEVANLYCSLCFITLLSCSFLVPDRPTGFDGEVLGTSSVSLTWSVPSEEMLRGDLDNVMYKVILDGGELVTPDSSILVDTLLIPGAFQRINVCLFYYY